MMNLEDTFSASHGSLVTCASCGTALNESSLLMLQKRIAAGGAHDADLCPMCRVTQHILSRMPPLENCPMCDATRVVRSRVPADDGAELLFCPHCDHMWTRSAESP